MDRIQKIKEGTVLVTGFSGRLGRRLVRRLHRSRPVLGLDRRGAWDIPEDVETANIEPKSSRARALFQRPEIGAIVHLGVIHDPRARREEAHATNLLSLQKIFEYAERFDIPKVILLSSANTYGPRPENPQFLKEDAPLLASSRFTEMHALVELDMGAQSFFWRSPKTELVILRPANILGTVRNAPSNYLRLARVPTLLGFDPMIQTIHQEDVVSAIELALQPGIRGIFNLAGPLAVPLSRALQILGRRTVPLPYTLIKGGLSGLFKMGMSRFPAPELDFIRYVCMVDDSLARRTLGYQPAYDLEATLHAVDEERWV